MALTKRIALSAAAMFLFIAITYMAIAFVKVDINPVKWGEMARFFFAFTAIGIGFCVFGIVMSHTEKK